MGLGRFDKIRGLVVSRAGLEPATLCLKGRCQPFATVCDMLLPSAILAGSVTLHVYTYCYLLLLIATVFEIGVHQIGNQICELHFRREVGVGAR